VRRLTTTKQVDRADELLAELASIRARIARQHVERLRALCAQIDLLTTELWFAGRRRHNQPDSDRRLQPLTAAEILAEVGDVQCFRTKA